MRSKRIDDSLFIELTKAEAICMRSMLGNMHQSDFVRLVKSNGYVREAQELSDMTVIKIFDRMYTTYANHVEGW